MAQYPIPAISPKTQRSKENSVLECHLQRRKGALQSSIASFPVVLYVVAKRIRMKTALMAIKATPTASTVFSRDGGLTKLGGLPSGFDCKRHV
jgi:hypothetical protein